uniref:Uncharacterized protein n=1 Tax=Lepeophtheirus salmonis TaxID=72036 RepID=A0A0K2V2D3_LEPSM
MVWGPRERNKSQVALYNFLIVLRATERRFINLIGSFCIFFCKLHKNFVFLF